MDLILYVVREGLSLLEGGQSPYEGDTCHEVCVFRLKNNMCECL